MNPADLAAHYRHFRVADRLLLTGHSHQAWPDVAREAQSAAYDDAAAAVDDKWDRAFAKADRLRAHYRALLGDPSGEIALGANTHELVVRLLSAIGLPARPRLVTTDGEFHTLRRQLGRLAEEGVEVVRVPAAPVDTLAERVAAATDARTAAVLVSAVLFETSHIVPGLSAIAEACARHGAELLVDAYHALGAIPFPLAENGLTESWVVGGGYKYLQLGEGNCFLRLPEHARRLRPVVTGWFAEFDAISDETDPDRTAYGRGATRFAGSTYDPTSHYRAARVADFFADHGLTADVLRATSLRQTTLLADAFDALDLPPQVIARDPAPRTAFGGFLALRTREAVLLRQRLAHRGVATDSRGDHLRFGPRPLPDRRPAHRVDRRPRRCRGRMTPRPTAWTSQGRMGTDNGHSIGGTRWDRASCEASSPWTAPPAPASPPWPAGWRPPSAPTISTRARCTGRSRWRCCARASIRPTRPPCCASPNPPG